MILVTLGLNITYEAISNSNTSDSDKKGPVPGTETTISDLQPFTIYNFTVIVIVVKSLLWVKISIKFMRPCFYTFN